MSLRKQLITAWVVAITAGSSSAQVAGSAGDDTNAVRSNPATVQAAASSGIALDTFQASPAIEQLGSATPGPVIGEPLGVGMKPWPPDKMSVDGAEISSFVESDSIRAQRDVLFRKFDLLLRTDIHKSPVFFGVDNEVKFVEHRDFQPGLPLPVGMSYRRGLHRLVFFGELTPILDPSPTTSLGWGGGVGIRFYFGR
jgi:hypothetical protein